MNKDEKGSIFLKILLLILGAAILVTAGILAGYVKGYIEDKDNYDKIRETAYRNTEEAAENPEEAIDFEALKKINPDIAGWLIAAGGDIDGPVVQAYDDEYYLNHRFDGSESSAGAFFADTGSAPAFKNPCTAVFGHNRKDGSMFHPLLNYKDESYLNENPVFTVYTEEGKAEYRIAAAFYSDYRDIPGIGDGEKDPETILKKVGAEDLYEGDPAGIVILCTCEYSGENNRMVVYGVKQKSQ